jgi:hypothetical protein
LERNLPNMRLCHWFSFLSLRQHKPTPDIRKTLNDFWTM